MIPGEVYDVTEEEGSFLCKFRPSDFKVIDSSSSKTTSNDPIINDNVCPYCGKETTFRNKRFHFDKCKEKKE